MDKKQKQDIAAIYGDPKFKSVMEVAEITLRNLDQMNTDGGTEYDTLRLSFERTFKSQAIIGFFQNLYRLAHDPESQLDEPEDRLKEQKDVA